MKLFPKGGVVKQFVWRKTMYVDPFENKVGDDPEVSEHDKVVAKINRLQKEKLFKHALKGIIEDENVIDYLSQYEINRCQQITFEDVVGDVQTWITDKTANDLIQICRTYFNSCKPDVIVLERKTSDQCSEFRLYKNPMETDLFDLMVDCYVEKHSERIIWISGGTSYTMHYGHSVLRMFGLISQKLTKEFLTGCL